jgi:ribosomal protein L11 methyltransferase
MREIVIRVRSGAVEEVLDRLLPLVPGGVREIPRGGDVELRMRGDDPLIIGGRLVVRPDWAPARAQPEGPGPRAIEIVLGDGAAFGAGTHPTTHACLELLLELEPLGAFVDLGCGTGVLAILAAKLGWEPVQAIDLQPASVEAATANARRNAVQVTVTSGDVCAQAPVVAGLAANLPPLVHSRLAAGLGPPLPRMALVSGFRPVEAEAVLDRYRAAGLHERGVLERGGWTIALLGSDS